MEKENLFDDVLETGTTENLDEGVNDVTDVAEEDCENYDLATYDDYDDGESVEDESEGNLGKWLIVGGMFASAVAGAYLAPKAKKAGAKVKKWVKSKINKEEQPKEEVIDVEVESKK